MTKIEINYKIPNFCERVFANLYQNVSKRIAKL